MAALRHQRNLPSTFSLVIFFIILLIGWKTIPSVKAEKNNSLTLTVQPTNCVGWEHAAQATTIDLLGSDGKKQFSEQNSAVFYNQPAEQITTANPSIVCSDFVWPSNIPDGQTLDKVEVIFSLALDGYTDNEDVVSLFVQTTDNTWLPLDSFAFVEDNDNAKHGGYWTYPLTLDANNIQTTLSQLKIKVAYDAVPTDQSTQALLDGVAVQLEFQRPEKPSLDEAITLPAPDFEQGQTPSVTVAGIKDEDFWGKLGFTTEQRTVEQIELIDPDGQTITPEYDLQNTTKDGYSNAEYKLRTNNFTKPGKYTFSITVDENGKTTTITRDFSWGVLTINVNQGTFAPDDQAFIQMGVLDETGHTLCDAELDLIITSPLGTATTLSTNDGSITYSSECAGDTVVELPDYYTYFDNGSETGRFELQLTATTANGEYEISDYYDVEKAPEFEVERVGPTRIWPMAPYTMEFSVTPRANFVGTVQESFPEDFVISNQGDGAMSRGTITWDVNWTAGETYELSYTFDAPDISPELYLLGPLVLLVTDNTVWEEDRAWQIASDTPDGTGILVYDEDGANNTTPHYRTWSTTDLSAESQLQDDETASDDTNHTIIESAPNRNEYTMGRLNASGHLDVQIYNGPTSAWINGTNAPTNGDFETGIGTTNDVYRGFDIAYESDTGDAIVVYENSSTGDGALKYQTWDGASWSGESSIDYSGVDQGNDVARWVECESDPGTDNILCGWREGTNLGVYGARWDGSAWQDIAQINAENGLSTRQDFDVAWEGSSGEGMIVYGDVTAAPFIDASTYTVGSGWSDTTGMTDPGAAVQWLRIADSPNNDYIAVIVQDTASTNTADMNVDMWNGSDWTTITQPTTMDVDINSNGFAQGIDVEWEQGGGDRALFAWRDGTTSETALRWMVFDVSAGQFQTIDDASLCLLTEGGAGTTEQVTNLSAAEDSNGPCSGLGVWADVPSGIDLSPDPSSDKIMLNAEDLTLDLVPESQLWNGASTGTWLTQTATMGAWEADLSTGATLTTSLPTKPYDFAFRASNTANVNVLGTQTSSVTINTTGNSMGGAFSINESLATANITSIMITEYGTVDAQADLDNIKLYYEPDTSAPYNCSSESFAGTETQYGSTDTDGFSSADGTSTFTGSVAITPTSTMCVYVVLDITSGASAGETVELEITTPSTDVAVSTGGIGPAYDREISGATTLVAPTVTVSGTCDAFDQSTDCTDIGTIKVAVDGSVQAQEDTVIAGTWEVTGVTVTTGQIVTVWVDAAASMSDRSGAVAKYDGSGDMTNIPLFKEHLTIGSVDGQTITNGDVGVYDNSVAIGDDDVFWDVSVDNDLTVDAEAQSSQEELYIDDGDTFQPASAGGGDVTSTHIEIGDTATTGVGNWTANNNSITVSGDFIVAGSAAYTATTGGIITFNSTSAAQTFTTGAETYQDITLNNTGSAGATDDLNVDGNLDVNGTFTITDGDLDLAVLDPNVTTTGNVTIGASGLVTKADNGTATWTFDGGAANWSDASSGQDIGLVSINGAPSTVTLTGNARATKVDVTTGDTLALGSSGYTLTLTGSGQGASRPFIVSGTLNEGTNSTVDFIGNAATDIQLESYWNLSVRPSGAVTFHANGGGTFSVLGNLVVGDSATAGIFNLDTNDPTFDVNGNITISAAATLIASGTGTFNVGGNWDNNATFTHSSGTVIFDAADTDNTIECGTSSFSSVTFIGSDGSGTWTMQTDNCTAAGTINVDTSDILTITTVMLTHSGVTLTLNGTISGTGTLRILNTSSGPGAVGTLSSVVRYDASTASIANTTFDARTYGGAVELYANNGAAKSITAAAGNYIFSSTLTTAAGGAGEVTTDLSAATGTTAVASDLTIGATTVFSAPATLNLSGNYTNNGTFTDNSGTVSLVGGSQQTMAGTMTGTSDFNALTITNNSGIDPDASPSVIFSTAATTAGTFTATEANVKIRFNATSTYTLTNIMFDGLDISSRVFLRSSSTGSAWLLAATGTRSVSNTNVKDSNATLSGAVIDATNGTNYCDSGNTNWTCTAGVAITGFIRGTNESTVYDCNADPLTIHVSVNGGANADGSCSADTGAYTVTATTPAAGQPVVVFIDSGETPDGTTITLAADGSAISNLDIYRDRVVLTHESAGPITNANLITADNGDAGILYGMTGSNIAVDSGMELHIKDSKSYDPGGTVTTTSANMHVDDNATAYLDTATNTIAGDLLVDGGATLNIDADTAVTGGDITTAGTSAIVTKSAGTPTVTMTGTGSIGGGTTPTLNFYNLIIGTASSAATTLSNSTSVTNTLNVDTGDSLALSSGVVLTHSGATLILNGTISGAGKLTYQSPTNFPTTGTISAVLRFDSVNNSQAMGARTYGGAVEIYNSSGVARAVTAAAGTLNFSSTLDLSRSGAGTETLELNVSDPTTTIAGALTIGAGTTLSANSTNQLNINGNYTNSGTFTDNSSTVTLAGGSQQTLDGTMTGSSDFNNLTITNTSGTDPDVSPSVIFSASATTAGNFTATTASTKLRFLAGGTYTFQNVSFNGQTITTRVALRSSIAATDWNLNVVGTRSIYNTDVKDSDACGQAPNIDGTAVSNLNSTGNTCWNFESLTFAISDTTVGFGDLTTSNARFATGDLVGFDTTPTVAHTFTIFSSAASGYVITYLGTTLTNTDLDTISAATVTNDTDGSPNSEQFAFGITTNGDGSIVADYNATGGAPEYKFVAGATTPFFSELGTTTTETISAYYLANIASTTEPGTYTTDITYIMTGTF